MNIISTTKKDEFCSEFLQTYLRDGFGALSKRETDLLIVRLLLKHSTRFNESEPPSAFELANELRITRSRARALLDELAYRSSNDEELIKSRLRSVLSKSERAVKTGMVSVQIEDGYLREYAKSIVQREYGIVDSSFDRTIITISIDRFLTLVAAVISPEVAKTLEKDLRKYKSKLDGEDGDSLIKKFTSLVGKKVADKAADEIIDVAFDVGKVALTSSLVALPSLIPQIFVT